MLDITSDKDTYAGCSIAFKSSDGAILKLCCTHYATGEDFDIEIILERRLPIVFSQALRTIRDHPLLAKIRHLHIKGGDLEAGWV